MSRVRMRDDGSWGLTMHIPARWVADGIATALEDAYPGASVRVVEHGGCIEYHVTGDGLAYYLSSVPAESGPAGMIALLRRALLIDEADGVITGADVARMLGLP